MMLRSGLRGVKIRVWQKQTVLPMIWTALAFGDTADPSTPDWGAAPCGDERHSGANAGLHGHAEMARLDTPVHAPPHTHTMHVHANTHMHKHACAHAHTFMHNFMHTHRQVLHATQHCQVWGPTHFSALGHKLPFLEVGLWGWVRGIVLAHKLGLPFPHRVIERFKWNIRLWTVLWKTNLCA